MRKQIFALIFCLSFIHSRGEAAIAPLYESVREYEVITNSIGTNQEFQNVIHPSEVIVEITRTTQEINNYGEIDYLIVTRIPSTDENSFNQEPSKPSTRRYAAKILVAPPAGIGRHLITLKSISPL